MYKLSAEDCDCWYRDLFYNIRLELERVSHHKYLPDNTSVFVEESVSDYRNEC